MELFSLGPQGLCKKRNFVKSHYMTNFWNILPSKRSTTINNLLSVIGDLLFEERGQFHYRQSGPPPLKNVHPVFVHLASSSEGVAESGACFLDAEEGEGKSSLKGKSLRKT